MGAEGVVATRRRRRNNYGRSKTLNQSIFVKSILTLFIGDQTSEATKQYIDRQSTKKEDLVILQQYLQATSINSKNMFKKTLPYKRRYS
ncbi:hypothetical protein L596_015870 [Steinernema carpocapsae]|uniref:Uncharacterized protein n=1 Tax=Steinernema carpocapsae TaxID=34508 RepID=A0A4U5NGB6_STECR|nr:hypothetical protein L596_015870 [Steinernema carpocapsae]